MNMSHIVKATELKLFAKFYDDWSKQSISNATSPNYANYEVTHALKRAWGVSTGNRDCTVMLRKKLGEGALNINNNNNNKGLY